jgi:hypothetical protein
VKDWLIIILFITNTAAAQKDSLKKQSGVIENKSIWMTKWVASSLLTPETPTIQLGVEFLPRARGHFGFEFTYGLKCIIGTNEFDSRFGRQYSKYQLEGRYYFRSLLDKKKSNFFLALEFFHVNYAYSKNNSAYIARNNIQYSYDFAHVNKSIDGYAIKIGYVFKLNSPIWLECFAGIGGRGVVADYSNVTNQQEVPILPGYSLSFFDFKVNDEGYSARPHLALGIKAIYKF